MGFIKILLLIVVILGVGYAGFVYGQLALQKNSVEVQIPIKQDVALSLDQEIIFPLKTSIEVPVNKTIYIKKTLPINTSIMIDTTLNVPMNISGSIVYVEVPIKQQVPIITSFEINESISISEYVAILINQNFSVPMKKDILIPIDTVIRTRIPLPWSNGQE